MLLPVVGLRLEGERLVATNGFFDRSCSDPAGQENSPPIWTRFEAGIMHPSLCGAWFAKTTSHLLLIHVTGLMHQSSHNILGGLSPPSRFLEPQVEAWGGVCFPTFVMCF